MTSWVTGVATVVCWLGTREVSAAQEPVSQSPPPQWQELGSRLIPLEEARGLAPVPAEPGQPEAAVECLLQEDLFRVAPDGSILGVHHRVRKLLKETGRDGFSTTTLRFRPGQSTIHVVTAQTLLPGGEALRVEKDGIFAEPVENGNDLIFEGEKQVRIVFPKTGAGAVTELIFVTEEKPWFDRHWSLSTVWGGFTPVRKQRFEIDCPGAMAHRLIWEDRKVDAEPVWQSVGEDCMRFAWEGRALPPIPLEPGMPAPQRSGPFLRVGLEGEWERVGAWLAGLFAQPAAGGSPALSRTAREWAGQATEPREIASRLLDTLSREVRYTGLEFGEGAWRPRDPATVLQTRYGDCKDQAHLLQALLAHHGIRSRVALLHSMPAGEGSPKIASLELFDHALVAIHFPGEPGPVYCDPTAEGVPLGMIGERDGGKEVLLVGERGEVEWGRLPDDGSTTEQVHAELEIEPDGVLSGWFDVRVGGAYGCHLRSSYDRLDREGRLRDAVSRFFKMVPGIRIVDAGPPGAEGSEWPFHVRFFVLQQTQAVATSAAKTFRFAFPAIGSFLTPVGPPATRRVHPYLATPAQVNVTASIRLPAGWEVLDQPANWSASGPGYEFACNWAQPGPEVLAGTGEMRRVFREFGAQQYQGFAASVRQMTNWVSTPVLLKRAAEPADSGAKETAGADPRTLPRMLTPDGFVALVNERFPFDTKQPFQADHESRKLAFERMGELYGKADPDADFTAQTMVLASRLFLLPSRRQIGQIVERLERLSRDFEGKVERRKIAGVELMLAGALSYAREREASIALFESLLKREGVPASLRQAAAGMLGILVAGTEPGRGAELTRQALGNTQFPDQEWQNLANVYLDCVARTPTANLRQKMAGEMRGLIQASPDRAELLKAGFLKVPDLLISYGFHDQARGLHQAILDEADDFGYGQQDLQVLAAKFSCLDRVAPFHDELATYLQKHPWPDLLRAEEGDLIESAADCLAVDGRNRAIAFRYVLRGLASFGPQADFAGRISRLHSLARDWLDEGSDFPEKASAPPAAIEPLLDVTLQLWKRASDGGDASAVDSRFAEGELIQRRAGKAAAEAFFLRLSQDASLDANARRVAANRVKTRDRQE